MTLAIHMDPVGGIAGDMFAAAMLDAFPDLEAPLRVDLAAAGVAHHVDLRLEAGRSKGLRCLRVRMMPRDAPARATPHYAGLRDMLAASALSADVLTRAQDILQRLAEAEAHVHGVPLSQVHFHEIADWDSLADIVAAASLIERSGVRAWTCGAVPLGSGRIQTEHGLMPLPAPAVARLLEGLSTQTDGAQGERVTPTGAAILRHLVRATAEAPNGVIKTSGTGAGDRDFPHIPNTLRLLAVRTHDISASTDRIAVLSFDIDDMTPEEMAVALDRIRLDAQVIEASHTLAFGKKGRAVFRVEVLAALDGRDHVAALCLSETATLGLRIDDRARYLLRREAVGSAPGAKRAQRPDGTWTAKAESDDLADIPTLKMRRETAARVETEGAGD